MLVTIFSKILGRIRQTTQALFAWSRPVEDHLAAQYLTPELFELFCRMSRSDRQHHIRVLKYLLNSGQTHPSLIVAALLHDVGKTSVRITIVDRVLAVLVKTISPNHFSQWSKGRSSGWRKAFVVSAQHPAWGAEMVATVGGDALAVQLIREHQNSFSKSMSEEFQTLLKWLKEADDTS